MLPGRDEYDNVLRRLVSRVVGGILFGLGFLRHVSRRELS
jgi:hypothetical protein